MENFFVQKAMEFAVSHQQWIEGAAVGYLISHPGWCAMIVFKGFIKIPFVGPWISKHPEEAKTWADQFDKAIDECIDKYAKENVSPAPQSPPAAGGL